MAIPDDTNNLETRAVAEAGLSELRWVRARQALASTYRRILRGSGTWSQLRRLLLPVLSHLSGPDFDCLVMLAGSGLPSIVLPDFLAKWTCLLQHQMLPPEAANYEVVLHHINTYFTDKDEEEDGRLPLTLLTFAWPSLALGGLLRLTCFRRELLSYTWPRWNGELPALFTQPYLGCLALSPELRALHAGWLETCRPNLLSAYSAMRAEQAQLHTFTRGQALPPAPYSCSGLIYYVSSFVQLLGNPRQLELGGGEEKENSCIVLLREQLADIVRHSAMLCNMSKAESDRNFSFICLLSGVAPTKQEAGPLVKPLAPCQQCEPNDILYLLHTYFTDDRAACARRHYVMLFSRLKYACPEGALAGLVECLPPHLVPWMDPQYPGYTKDYGEELPDLLQQDFIGQFHLDHQARALHTAYLTQVISERKKELEDKVDEYGCGEEAVSILEAVDSERRLLARLYPGQTIPAPPYSLTHLLQYVRSYWLKVAVDRRRRKKKRRDIHQSVNQ